MAKNTTAQGVLFDEVLDKPTHVVFDQPDSSVDGGAILLKAIDEKLNLTQRLAACITDHRDPDKVVHPVLDQFRQRVFGVACGYEDCNDAARLADDPIHKQIVGRAKPEQTLASQSTLCRFENAANSRSLLRMADELADIVVQRHRERLGSKCRLITIDMDPTDDPTYGAQQLTLFNGYYDNWCYLPMACFLSFDQEPDQYLFAYMLRPGDASATLGAVNILQRIVAKLRKAFPKATLRVRLDGGFATPEIFDYLDDNSLQYVVAMASNSSLLGLAEPLMEQVRHRSEDTAQSQKGYASDYYCANSWDTERRVIIKAQVLVYEGRAPRDNARFVITNLRHSPQHIYEQIYCYRANVENRIKELLNGLQIDRTSCTRFFANQFRGLLTAAAYVLMQELRLSATGTSLSHAQVATLRNNLLKMAVWVKRSTRRIVMHCPQSSPWKSEWTQIARKLGAVPL